MPILAGRFNVNRRRQECEAEETVRLRLSLETSES